MAIGFLRQEIGFEGVECPPAEDLEISPSFDFLKYRNQLREMFQNNRKYFVENDDDNTNLEKEDEMIRQSTADLCDILIKPEVNHNQKGKKIEKMKFIVSKVKLVILLEKHSLQNLTHCIVNFTKGIQGKVSTDAYVQLFICPDIYVYFFLKF